MYPEFIPMYIGLVIIIVLLIVILCLVAKRPTSKTKINPANNSTVSGTKNIVFCKNCATQFDSSQYCCPKCGTPR